jgi:hypothetical protein
LTSGWVNDRSIVSVNGDLFSQSLEPGIRSLQQSVRNFTQWGMTDLSANERRILQFVDRSLLRFSSGIFINNRLLQTSLPRQTPQGVVHDAVIPLDFIPISSFNQQRQPNWEGNWQSVPILQLSMGDFGGLERAFASVRSEVDGSLQLWELVETSRVDSGNNRIMFQVETPAFSFANSIGALELKKLVSAELWIDRLFGIIDVDFEYRPDSAVCWMPWARFKECSPQNTEETSSVPIGYGADMGPCYRSTLVLPKPPETCAPCGTGRPSYIARQFQFRLTIKGSCRVRGIWALSEKVEEGMYHQKFVC